MFWSRLVEFVIPHSNSSNSCRIRSLWRICAFVTSKKTNQLQKNNQIIKSPLFHSGLHLWSDLFCWRLPELPPVRLPYLLEELWMSIRCPSSSTWAGGTRSRATSSTWWCLLVWPNIFATPIQSHFFNVHAVIEWQKKKKYTTGSTEFQLFFTCKLNAVSFDAVPIRRSTWGDGVRLGHPRHGHLRSPDDVHHHAAHRLLHRLGVWWRDDGNAVLAAHQVTKRSRTPQHHRCLSQTRVCSASSIHVARNSTWHSRWNFNNEGK